MADDFKGLFLDRAPPEAGRRGELHEADAADPSHERQPSRDPAGLSKRDEQRIAMLEDENALLRGELAQVTRMLGMLRESEARHRMTFDQAGVGIAHANLDGRFFYANQRWCELLGYSQEEISQLTFLQLTHPDDLQSTVRANDRLVRDEIQVVSTEKRYVHKNGQPVWVHLVASRVQNTETGAPYYISIITDISARKHADDLRNAAEIAEAANRAKSEFLAVMSHEIRTPLNGIIGMTELALGTELTAEQRDYLQTIHDSGKTLLAIVNNILDLSKIEAGKLSLDPVAFSLRELVQSSLRALEVRAQKKGLALTLACDDDVPDRLRGDSVRLRQILSNLVDNALKFTERGGVHVTVNAKRLPGGAVRLKFAVADTGVGIPRERLAAIFAPFEQAHSSTTRLYGGTGLGLGISAELCRLMDGEITVESELAVGSVFRFTVRLELAPEPSLTTPSGVASRPGATAPTAVPATGGVPRRILVVDDNEINRKVASQLLARRGFLVELAENGRQALARLEQEAFDLILMDVQMPEIDGLEATRRLRERERERGERLPVVGLTASAMDGDKERCLAAGMDAYLTKPVRPGTLYEVIEGYIERRGGPAPAAGHGERGDD